MISCLSYPINVKSELAAPYHLFSYLSLFSLLRQVSALAYIHHTCNPSDCCGAACQDHQFQTWLHTVTTNQHTPPTPSESVHTCLHVTCSAPAHQSKGTHLPATLLDPGSVLIPTPPACLHWGMHVCMRTCTCTQLNWRLHGLGIRSTTVHQPQVTPSMGASPFRQTCPGRGRRHHPRPPWHHQQHPCGERNDKRGGGRGAALVSAKSPATVIHQHAGCR
jgi:hypothetical protein